MVKKEVRWTLRSIHDKLSIYDYWINRNKSKNYILKLDRLFLETASLLAEFPESGKQSSIQNIRVKAILQFHIFYKVEDDALIIITIWDSRRNPKQLKIT